jgi:5,10-methylenetetrahydromethanopterin reductase
MATDRVALYLQDAHDLRQGLEYVRYAEGRGFEAVWQAESRLVRDAVVPMAAYAAVTERIKVGSGVINNWTRNIGLLAATFLTLDDLAPNRVICGIGAWWDPLARNVGVDRRNPLQAMRETVEVLRRLLAMERVTFHGEFHHVEGIELDVVHGRREPRNVPIYIGATGPKMMELTGEIADGVVLNYCVPPEYNAEALEQLEAGARRAGRSLDRLDRPQLVATSRHLTGGGVDLLDVDWKDGVLSGRSAVVGGEPYEIFVTEDAWRLAEVRCDGADALPVTRDGPLVASGCRPAASGEIRWQARFDPPGRPVR